MTRIIAATHGMSQQSMMQPPYHLKCKSQTPETPRTGTRIPFTSVAHSEKNRNNIGNTRHTNVHTIAAEDIICIEDKTIWSRKSWRQMVDTSSPPPSQTASEPPTQRNNHNNEDVTACPQQLRHDLNVIKEFIQHDKNNDYVPLMSAITRKKKKG